LHISFIESKYLQVICCVYKYKLSCWFWLSCELSVLLQIPRDS